MRRSHLRLGIRLARRELRRRPWRTALVLFMVLIPSVAMTLVVTGIRTNEWTREDRLRAELGRADLSVHGAANNGPRPQDLALIRSRLPAGSTLQVERTGFDRTRVDGRRAYVNLTDLALDDEMNEGMFSRLRGRAAADIDEAVVTEELADVLDLDLGDRFELDGTSRVVRVVGVVFPNGEPTTQKVYLGAMEDEEVMSAAIRVDVPGADAATGDMVPTPEPASGWSFISLGYVEQNMTQGLPWTYVGGGVGLIVLATVITAAFAVGARRQLRSIGLLSASGAPSITIRWFLVAQGVVAGALGSLLGILIALVIARLLPDDLVETIAERPVSAPVTRAGDLVPILLLGSAVAAIAAWLPARSIAKVPTLQALAGRRPLPTVPRRLPVLGALSVGAGCGLLAMAVAGARGSGSSLWVLVAVLGGMAVLLGAIAIGPWVVSGLERVGGRAPTVVRVAGRSLARNRVRSSAVIGSIVAVATLVVCVGTLYESARSADVDQAPYLMQDELIIGSNETRPSADPDGQTYSSGPRPTEAIEGVEDIVPGAVEIPLLTPVLRELADAGVPADARVAATYVGPDGERFGGPTSFVAVASPKLVAHLDLPPRLRTALAQGEAVALERPAPSTDSISLEMPISDEGLTQTGPQIPFGGWFDSPRASDGLPSVLIGSSALDRAGLVAARSSDTLMTFPQDLTAAQRDRLQILSEDLSWERDKAGFSDQTGISRSVYLALPSEPPFLTEAQIKGLLLLVALLLVLAIVAVGLALAAQDSEDEQQVLVAIGAAPRTIHRVNALRAVALVLIGGLIAVPAGLLPAAAVEAAWETDVGPNAREFVPDLESLLLVLVVVPLVAGLVTWAGGRLRSWVRPRRPDVFAFGE